MRSFLLSSLVATLVVLGLCRSPARAVQDAVPRGKRIVTPVSEEPLQKPRYPALAYAVAILIILIVVTLVAFPSRKETWDQRVGNKRGSKRVPWD
jgi:hypothetical protein